MADLILPTAFALSGGYTLAPSLPLVGGVEAVYADENVWLSPKMLGLLYDVDVRTIS